MERRIDFADFLINKKQYLNDSDENGVTALFYAVQMGDCQTVQTLLKMGAKPEFLLIRKSAKSIRLSVNAHKIGEEPPAPFLISKSTISNLLCLKAGA
jgi:ankyrin repeat protein